MELLDSLRLPKTRTEHYLIGIWILNKGKLAPPPTVSTPNPIPPPAPQFNTFNPPSHMLHPTPPPPPMSAIPNIPMGLPPLSHAPPPPLPPAVNSAALAAEVASLTPEQIQRMLQSLTAGGTSISGILQQPPPMPPQQPWMNNASPTHPYGGIPYQPHPHPHAQIHTASQSPPQHPSYAPPPLPLPAAHYQYDQYEQYEQYDSGPRRGRGERGGRGRGGPGRGNARERVSSGDLSRERDTGWGKRGGRGSHSERPY